MEATDEIFTDLDLNGAVLRDLFFTECSFEGLSLVEADLSRSQFQDCRFTDCNLSLTAIRNTALRNVSFTGCKLMGLNFCKASTFILRLGFEDCRLMACVFAELKLPRTVFKQCCLSDCDFGHADLSAADFSEARFERCLFDQTNLSAADFRGASGFNIDPARNRLAHARFDYCAALELLGSLDIVID